MVNITNLVRVAAPVGVEIRYVCTDPAVQKAAHEVARDGIQLGRSIIKLADETTQARRRYRDGRPSAR